MTALLLVALVLALLVLRQPLLVILTCAVAFVHTFWGAGRLEYVVEDMWVALDKDVILAIPMFVLCGGVMTKGATARRLIDIAAAATQHLPGGLAVACVMSCGIFAAISGSSIVTMLAVGSVMLPALMNNGYPGRFSLGLVMAGGTLGIVIPPSVPLIIYGLVTETSITDLFIAGIGPGILLLTVFAGYSMWVNRHLPTKPFSMAQLLQALRRGVWALMMPVILLGGIYTGWFSATEAAAVGLLYALLVEIFIHREMRLPEFGSVMLEAAKLGGTFFPLLAAAMSLNLVLTEHRVPEAMVQWAQQYIHSPLAFMLIVNALLLAVGCLVTTGEAILILAPLLAPLAVAYGYDPVAFGVIMIVNLEIGFLTPPVGLNLMVAMSAFKQKFGDLVVAAVPWILLMLACLALVSWQPWIAMYLVGGGA
ncbi:C4-dicarboxylate TRAP transporter large permease protein DctM [Alicycliphilus denitrificans]|uniref:TRAP transporter large permease n=1 Tax=Alicycliphilus denitrificans TaxID=179636 RepID=UPI0019161C28|nr:TRAP transporter large permease subunit [Alicycliphilus denitrificans]MBN9575587.1 TRAP transporter large permease subunit [Alicycliphilus denitrificans]BCN38499.1 C4-dicarboxylate TRAP transporter large permease protein DctM [Alicycliphilus denitrificans]